MALFMQCQLGLACKEFVMIAADQINMAGILIISDDEKKILKLSDRTVLSVTGDSGDTAQLSQYIAQHMKLYQLRNGYQLDTPAVAHFTRRSLNEGLNSGGPFMLNLLIGGFDEKKGGLLYCLDLFASCVQVQYRGEGFGGMLNAGILDQFYKPTMSEKGALWLLKLCIANVQQRLLISLPKFQVVVVGREGVRDLPTITPESLIELHEQEGFGEVLTNSCLII